MTAFDEDAGLSRKTDLRLLRRFLRYLRPHLGPALGSLALVLAGVGADLAPPFILRAALDGPVRAKDPDGLLVYGGAFLALVLLSGLIRGLEYFASNVVGQRVIYDLRTETFAHLQRMHAGYFDRNPVGRLMTRVTNDIENLSEFFSSGLVGLLGSLLLLFAALGAMLSVDWRLTLWTMITLPPAVAAAAVFRRYSRRAQDELRRAVAALAAFLNESIGGMRTIQAFNRQASCALRFDERGREVMDKSVFTAYVYSCFWPGIEVIVTCAMALLLWGAGKAILQGTLSFGSFMAFWLLLRLFFDPFHELAEKYNVLQAAMVSADRIFRILDTRPSISAPPSPAKPPLRGEVSFEGVHFSYDGKTPILSDVTFRVRPGEKVALVGATGAGKTTILSLLLRLYDASAGRILVDGIDVRDQDPRELRRRFGMVFQDVFLFSGTVHENIALGEDLSAPDLERALEIANARALVARLPGGTQSKLHERGSSLSTGERQLLSFARALASDPPTLVLDEATSNIDARTEALIQQAMDRILEGRTAIIVAHRLSTVRKVDRILVLHKGRLREEGTHDELLARGGLYEKLYRLQWRP